MINWSPVLRVKPSPKMTRGFYLSSSGHLCSQASHGPDVHPTCSGYRAAPGVLPGKPGKQISAPTWWEDQAGVGAAYLTSPGPGRHGPFMNPTPGRLCSSLVCGSPKTDIICQPGVIFLPLSILTRDTMADILSLVRLPGKSGQVMANNAHVNPHSYR